MLTFTPFLILKLEIHSMFHLIFVLVSWTLFKKSHMCTNWSIFYPQSLASNAQQNFLFVLQSGVRNYLVVVVVSVNVLFLEL